MSYRQPFRGDYPITQGFGRTEYNPNHTGIDYGCPTGTPIYASADGTVFYTGWKDGGYGNCVFIKHPDGFVTIYEHLSKVSVTVGQTVKQGQTIGYSGSTGNSTGPHLHFEIRNADAKPVNPLTMLMSVDDSITPVPTPTPAPNPEKPALKGADALGHDVEVVAPAGAWGWNADFTRRVTAFPEGTKLTFTGKTTQRLGYTYCEVYPEPVKYWVAVNDGDCQILDND